MKYAVLAVAVGLPALLWIGCGGADTSIADPTPDAGATPADAGEITDTGGGATDATSEDAAPPGVSLTYGTCEPFTKCGGDLVGTWKVTGGCLSDETFADLKSACPDLAISDTLITGAGTVTVTATNVQRKTSIHLTGKAKVPKSCVIIPNADCNTVAGFLKTAPFGGPKFDSATCKDNGMACDCDLAISATENSDATYTTADGTLTSDSRTFDYCVNGAKTTYIETTKTPGQSPLLLYVEIAK